MFVLAIVRTGTESEAALNSEDSLVVPLGLESDLSGVTDGWNMTKRFECDSTASWTVVVVVGVESAS